MTTTITIMMSMFIAKSLVICYLNMSQNSPLGERGVLVVTLNIQFSHAPLWLVPLAFPVTLRSAGYHRTSIYCFGAILQQTITWDYADQVLKLPCGVTMGLLMTNIMINQHWPRQWFGIVRQKALLPWRFMRPYFFTGVKWVNEFPIRAAYRRQWTWSNTGSWQLVRITLLGLFSWIYPSRLGAYHIC